MESSQYSILRDRPVKLSELLNKELLHKFVCFSINAIFLGPLQRERFTGLNVCAVFFPRHLFLSCHCPVSPGLGLCYQRVASTPNRRTLPQACLLSPCFKVIPRAKEMTNSVCYHTPADKYLVNTECLFSISHFKQDMHF